jgi:hypothetical protein
VLITLPCQKGEVRRVRLFCSSKLRTGVCEKSLRNINMSDQSQPSAVLTTEVYHDFVKTVVQDVLDGVMPIIKSCQTTIEELAARLDSAERLVIVQQAKIEAISTSYERLQDEHGLIRVELQKLQYHADVRQCQQAAGNICAFPVKRPPQSSDNAADPEKLLQTLASEVPGVKCAVKPFKSGGFKISFQAGSCSTAQQSASKAIEAAPTFLARHGLAVTRDLPRPLRTVRQKVQSFVSEVRRSPRFSNLKIELSHGHVKINNKPLGPEYLWPNAISVGKDELIDLIGLSEFCICSNWEKGLLHDHLVRLNHQYFASRRVQDG